MSFAADFDRAALTVLLDVRHPFAYLALGPAVAFARGIDGPVDWLPLRAQPLRPPAPPARGDGRGARHKHHRAQMIAREIAIYAAAQGCVVKQPYRDGATEAAHLAWLWVRAQAPGRLTEFLERLFRRYWSLELDPGQLDAVSEAVASIGLDPEAFRAWAASDGAADARALEDQLAELGLFQTPAYVVRDEVFYGRQHLPMIRWLLDGRRGPVPI